MCSVVGVSEALQSKWVLLDKRSIIICEEHPDAQRQFTFFQSLYPIPMQIQMTLSFTSGLPLSAIWGSTDGLMWPAEISLLLKEFNVPNSYSHGFDKSLGPLCGNPGGKCRGLAIWQLGRKECVASGQYPSPALLLCPLDATWQTPNSTSRPHLPTWLSKPINFYFVKWHPIHTKHGHNYIW